MPVFSVAGKRAGLEGKSGLFYEAVRVLKEMHQATDGRHPKFAVMENVAGIFSSKTHGKSDFLEVLNELVKIKDEALAVPMPESGKWSTAGLIVGDGLSLGWRTFDSQYWGVAQRRRRCYIILDLAGERAEEILFDETRLRGHPPQGFFARQRAAGCLEGGSGGAVAFEPGAVARLGGHCWDDGPAPTLRADMGDNQTAVVFDARGNGGGGAAPTITGDHNNRVTDHTALALESRTFDIRQTSDGTVNARNHAYETGISRSLDRGVGIPGTNHGGIAVVEPRLFGIDSNNSNSMKSSNPCSGIHEMSSSRTLDTGACSGNGGQVVVAFAENQRSEIRDLHGRAGALAAQPGMKQQTFIAQERPCYGLEGNGQRPSHRGSGVSEEVSPTLNSVEQHQVAYAVTTGSFTQVTEEQSPTLQARDCKGAPAVNSPAFGIDRAAFNQGQNALYKPSVSEEQQPTIVAKGPGAVALPDKARYIVRRLTPTECALLQGFPQDWCSGLGTPDPTDTDIAFWAEVFEAKARIEGKKARSKHQIAKWLQDPYTDSAAYAMWGNGVCLNNVHFVLSGIAHCCQKRA